MPSPRRLQYMLVDQLVPAPRNPKLHDIAGIQASMTELGFIEPTIIDERTGRLVSGHGRTETLLAAQEAGLDPPEGIIVTPKGKWQVPVVRGWSSVDDRAAETALVALNRYVERGGWNNDDLVAILNDLDDDLRLIAGYGESDFAALIALDQPATPQTERDGGDQSERVGGTFGVIIDCADEDEQAKVLDELLGMGMACRALM